MTVLVTGANGFIGAEVVRAFLRRGIAVRGLVRPSSAVDGLAPLRDLEIFRADLRTSSDLSDACRGVDAVVHLAARMGGDEAAQFETTVRGTERLLEAVGASASAPRFVLASSFAVYDWTAAEGRLTERSPVVGHDLGERGPYTVAKVWQERVARRMARERKFELVVLRPGFVWGPGHVTLSGMGQRYGPLRVVFGRDTALPLTYVENCAEAFVEAALARRVAEPTYNVVDDERVTSRRYTREYLDRTGSREGLLAVPYPLALSVSRLGNRVGRRMFPPGRGLPDNFIPRRMEAQFKPLEFPNDRARDVLGWRPRVAFAEALEAAYGAARTAEPQGRT